jgi:Ca2+-binding EF-hand superfamily protein
MQLREACDMFDKSGNGFVEPDDFWRMAYLCGMTNQDSISEMLIACDTDGDGRIDFVEFIGMMTGSGTSGQVELRGHLAVFREAFNLFDSDSTGSITSKQFHNAVRMLGYRMTVKQVCVP